MWNYSMSISYGCFKNMPVLRSMYVFILAPAGNILPLFQVHCLPLHGEELGYICLLCLTRIQNLLHAQESQRKAWCALLPITSIGYWLWAVKKLLELKIQCFWLPQKLGCSKCPTSNGHMLVTFPAWCEFMHCVYNVGSSCELEQWKFWLLHGVLVSCSCLQGVWCWQRW